MRYQKPEVAVLGDAAFVIQGMKSADHEPNGDTPGVIGDDLAE